LTEEKLCAAHHCCSCKGAPRSTVEMFSSHEHHRTGKRPQALTGSLAIS